MKQTVIEANGVALREITEADLELVRQWRNDPEIAQYMLTQQYISEAQQLRWFASISGARDQQHFLILYKQQAIGVTNVKAPAGSLLANQKQLETGLYIGEQRFRGSFLAFCPALTLHDYCFLTLSCHTLTATVLPSNQAALRFNQRLGYKVWSPSSQMENTVSAYSDDIVTMHLSKQDYMQASAGIRRFIR